MTSAPSRPPKPLPWPRPAPVPRPAPAPVPDDPRYFRGVRLTLVPTPAGDDCCGRDPARRLAQALKRLLRDYGLRCVRIEPGGADGDFRPAKDSDDTTCTMT